MKKFVAALAVTVLLSSCVKQHYGCKCFSVVSPNSFTVYDIGKKTNPSATSVCNDMQKDFNKNSTIPVICETGIYGQ